MAYSRSFRYADYGGISASRLEVLEERLRDDVIAELQAFGGQLLLHTETPDGTVVPVWEDVREEDVMVLKDVMASRPEVHYARVPITAERSPDFSDLSQLIDIVLRCSRDTPLVVNCQLGRGRSTLASIILLLIRQWLDAHRQPTTPHKPRRQISMMSMPAEEAPHEATKNRHSYQVINSGQLCVLVCYLC